MLRNANGLVVLTSPFFIYMSIIGSMQKAAVNQLVGLSGDTYFSFKGSSQKIPCVIGDDTEERFNVEGGLIDNVDLVLQVSIDEIGPLSNEDMTNWKTRPDWLSNDDTPFPKSGLVVIVWNKEFRIIGVSLDGTGSIYSISLGDKHNRDRV